MSTVYVINEPYAGAKGFKYDISPCLQYGQPEFIFRNDEYPGNNVTKALFKAREVLKNFDPMEDFILWAGGDPITLALVSSLLAERGMGYRFLCWERERANGVRTGGGYYVPQWVDMTGKYIRKEGRIG